MRIVRVISPLNPSDLDICEGVVLKEGFLESVLSQPPKMSRKTKSERMFDGVTLTKCL
jgi:hypothetical protein